ncbi:aminotransferase class I/II-fold pyridoxal phosphate-dependent enzyme, partial [Cribrihabitans sp. XS_ASV171]
NGVTPAMFTALAVVANPGEVIAADTFSSHTLAPAAQHLHVGLKGVEGDERGMIPEALIEAARESPGQMKAVFLLPGGAGPQARIMDRERREALARAAEEVGLAILECDPLGPLAAKRPPPIASLAPGRTFYFTGMSKSLAPGVRLGVLAIPEDQVELTVNRHQSVSWMATPLVAEIASDWLENGTADRLLLAHRAELSARNRMAQRLLGLGCLGNLHGLHRWMPLSEGTDEGAVIRRLLEEGVAVAPGSGFSISDTRPAIRICLGATGRRDLEQGLIKIASILPPAPPDRRGKVREARAELS